MLRAWSRIGTVRPQIPFWPWLATVARHIQSDAMRTRSGPRTIPLHTANEGDDRGAERAVASDFAEHEVVELRLDLASAFSRLRPRERTILWLHSIERFEYAELAHSEGISVNAMRNMAWRSRMILRAALADVGVGIHAVWPGAFLESARAWVRRRNAPSRRWGSWLQWTGPYEALGNAFVGFGLVVVAALPLRTVPAFEPPIAISPVLRAASGDVGEGSHRAPDRARAPDEDRARPIAVQPLRASVETAEPRSDRVAPSEGRIVLEMRTPDGSRVVRDEYGFSCDAVGSSVLPRQGPVRAMC